MTIGINSDYKSSKKLPFLEWFAKSPGSRIDVYKVFTRKAEIERIKANRPASFVYTVNREDRLTKKVAKIALKILCYSTVIPIISMKLIDFFKGKKRTLESDLQGKLEEMKSKIREDQKSMNLILENAHLTGGKPLPTSNKELESLYEMVLNLFKDKRKAAEFLSVLGEGAGVILGQELVKDPNIKKFITPRESDKNQKVELEKSLHYVEDTPKKGTVHIKLGQEMQIVDAVFDLAQLVSKTGHKLEKHVSGVAKVRFDFRKEQVTLSWGVKANREVKPRHYSEVFDSYLREG